MVVLRDLSDLSSDIGCPHVSAGVTRWQVGARILWEFEFDIQNREVVAETRNLQKTRLGAHSSQVNVFVASHVSSQRTHWP